MGLGKDVLLPAAAIGVPTAALLVARHEEGKDRAQIEERVSDPLQVLYSQIERCSRTVQEWAEFGAQVDSLGDALFAFVAAHDPSDNPELNLMSTLRRKHSRRVLATDGLDVELYKIDYGIGKEEGRRGDIARRAESNLDLKVNGDSFSLSRAVTPVKRNSVGEKEKPFSYDKVELVRASGGRWEIASIDMDGKDRHGHKWGVSQTSPTLNLVGIRETRNALLRIARVVTANYPRQILGKK